MATHFLSSAVETLDKVPPPAPKQTSEPLRYTSYAKAFNKMMALRRTLGITEPEQKVFNVGKLNARIAELEAMQAAKSAPQVGNPAPEKSVFDLSMSEIRERCRALEAELGVPSEPVSEQILLARSRLCMLESDRTMRASVKLLASLPAAPSATVVPSAPEPAKDVEPELKGRARFVASCRVLGADKPSPQIDPSLTGRKRMVASINATGFMDLTKSETDSKIEAAEQPIEQKELTGRARMKSAMKIRNSGE